MSPRVQQLEAIFDAPLEAKQRMEWHMDVPLEARPWSVGLIVGPSGSGKTQVGTAMFGSPIEFDWTHDSVLDDFGDVSMGDVTKALGAVGFNTIPAWVRPYRVLSVGEQFRVTLARALLSGADPVFIDEFTSTVDRQVGKIASYAVQKYVRKRGGMHFVAATCHYDVVEWLQPDWVLEPAAGVLVTPEPGSPLSPDQIAQQSVRRKGPKSKPIVIQPR
jgi:ABC-type glutathione transport system ATPase component